MAPFERRNREKGQDLIEYALMLAIVVGIGGFIYSSSGLSDSIKSIFGSSSSLMKVAALQTTGKSVNMDDLIAKIQDISKNYMNRKYGDEDKNADRGFISSNWLSGDENSTLKEWADALGATNWTYYNDKNRNHGDGKVNPADQGFYWTTDDLSKAGLTAKDKNNNYSNEKVLSYYYNEKDKQYYVLKNNVWLHPNNGPELAAKSQEWKKPAAEVVGSFGTREEAERAYESAKAANGGSTVFK